MTREAEEALFRITPALTDEELAAGPGVPSIVPAVAPPALSSRAPELR